jgi:hypothetical protein
LGYGSLRTIIFSEIISFANSAEASQVLRISKEAYGCGDGDEDFQAQNRHLLHYYDTQPAVYLVGRNQ